MEFMIDDLPVIFPYDVIYPEQYFYMTDLKKTLDAPGHCVLEMPSGTGKTVSLLSLIISYMTAKPDEYTKLVYTTRTVGELDKVAFELDNLFKYIEKVKGQYPKLTGLMVSSRKNLCINKVLRNLPNALEIDGGCYSMTAPHRRSTAADKSELCSYFENYFEESKDFLLPHGVYRLEDLIKIGENKHWCPYFMARNAIYAADIVIYSYYYLLDPKISEIVSKDIGFKTIVVFDEAHNIDNICINTMSADLTEKNLRDAMRQLKTLRQDVEIFKRKDAQSLRDEYNNLLQKLKQSETQKDPYMITPMHLSPVPIDNHLKSIQNESIPGSIRKIDNFLDNVLKFVDYLMSRLNVQFISKESSPAFTRDLLDKTDMKEVYLKSFSARLNSLLNVIKLENPYKLKTLSDAIDFAVLLCSYDRGFVIMVDPLESKSVSLYCMDASIAILAVFTKYKSVVITSGTLTPLWMFPKILNFQPVLTSSFPITLSRDAICPMIVSRGINQVALTSKFNSRFDLTVLESYSWLLKNLVRIVPDGMVVFFTSYTHMTQCIKIWGENGTIRYLSNHKILFFETEDMDESRWALRLYRRMCDSGAGALLFCVARGKVAEGVDFEKHYCRCVIIIGVPYVYTESQLLHSRLDFLRESYEICENDYLTFDAMRHAAQCLGRTLRSKDDYGMMILADSRYCKLDKRQKLPRWIQQYILDSMINISVEEVEYLARHWFRKMGQPVSIKDQLGTSKLSIDDINNPDLMEKFANIRESK